MGKGKNGSMGSESGTKKREGEDEIEEEMKMEKFYSLLRSFRDARDRRRKELEELESNERKTKKMKGMKRETSSWVPSFEWEDFNTEIEFRRPPLIFLNPCPCDVDKGKKEKRQDDGLDLKLAL